MGCMLVCYGTSLIAQDIYPDPGSLKEIYWYRKDSSDKLKKLEKQSSMLDRLKPGGLFSRDVGYSLEGEISPVKLSSGDNLSFVFATKRNSTNATSILDSLIKSTLKDSSKGPGFSGTANFNPDSSLALYKAIVSKGKRKILLQKSGGLFGNKKTSLSEKISYSINNVREGYWEFLIGQSLTSGEYAFTLVIKDAGILGDKVVLFAFRVE